MSLLIKYVLDCTCGAIMSSTTLDLSQEPGGAVEVDLDMVGDMALDCPDCDRKWYVPNLSDYIEEVE